MNSQEYTSFWINVNSCVFPMKSHRSCEDIDWQIEDGIHHPLVTWPG